MRCPFKFGRYGFEGGEGCDRECAWRVAEDGAYGRAFMCAIAAIAEYESDGSVRPANYEIEGKRE